MLQVPQQLSIVSGILANQPAIHNYIN